MGSMASRAVDVGWPSEKALPWGPLAQTSKPCFSCFHSCRKDHQRDWQVEAISSPWEK